MKQLDGLGIDFAGFEFDAKSPWYVGGKIAGKELKDADFDIRKVGVFTDAGYDEIMKAIDEYGIDVVQLQGNETPELCEKLSRETEVIKAFTINDPKDSIDEQIADYDEVCDYYLFNVANRLIGNNSQKAVSKNLFFSVVILVPTMSRN